MNYRYRLAHSREIKKKHWNNVCPSCGQRKFSPYIDTVTNQPIAAKECGRCCREKSCAYHMTPSEWFKDNPPEKREWLPREQYMELIKQRRKEEEQAKEQTKKNCLALSPLLGGRGQRLGGGLKRGTSEESEATERRGYAVEEYYKRMSTLCAQTRSDKNHLARWLCTLFPENQVAEVLARYRTGSTRDGRIIYWQIDERGQVRAGKVMAYDPNTGRRIKNSPPLIPPGGDDSNRDDRTPPPWGRSGGSPPVCWVHSMTIDGIRFDEMLAPQCLFGLHLIETPSNSPSMGRTQSSQYEKNAPVTPSIEGRRGMKASVATTGASAPQRSVAEQQGGGSALVESEKTALILSLLCPDKVWLATGGKANFKEAMLMPLLGYEVEVYPDADALTDWYARTVEMNRTLGTHLHIPTWYYDLMNHDEARRAGLDLADVLLG